MSLRGNNFFHTVLTGVALVPQSVGQATVNGVEIEEPWTKGRQISFFLLGGVFGAAASGRARIQGLLRSDGTTWQAINESDGTTPLEFTVTLLDDATQIENGSILGTLDLGMIDGDTHKSLRLTFEQETAAVTALIACGYIIFDTYKHPSGQVDDLFNKVRPTVAL